MSKDRFTLPVAVFLVLKKEDKVLLMRRANTGWCDGCFDLIAGHIDGDESLTTAVIREASEEMGIELAPENTHFAHLLHIKFSDGKEYFNPIFTADTWSGEPHIMEPDKCDLLEWFSLDSPPENLTPSARLGLKALASGAPYSESGFGENKWTERVFTYGTLMQSDVQQRVIGRTTECKADILRDYDVGNTEINGGIYRIVSPSVGKDVEGAVLFVSPDELEKFDIYETSAYDRKKVTLESGVEAWVYVRPGATS